MAFVRVIHTAPVWLVVALGTGLTVPILKTPKPTLNEAHGRLAERMLEVDEAARDELGPKGGASPECMGCPS